MLYDLDFHAQLMLYDLQFMLPFATSKLMLYDLVINVVRLLYGFLGKCACCTI